MARFRKGTNDHDNDGHKGGSLKAGTRFVPGTTDHDSDGRMGGSLKGDINMARKKTAAKAAKTLMEKGVVKTADIKAPRQTTRDVKTTRSDETAEAKPTLPEKQQAAAEQFAKADAAGVPEETPEALTARTAAGLAF